MSCPRPALQKRLRDHLDNVCLVDFGNFIDLISRREPPSSEFLRLLEVELKEPPIKIIMTSALLRLAPHIMQMRQDEYVKSLQTLKDYGYRPYVVEACQKSPPSPFEDFTNFVFYSSVNNYRLKNKGVNESKSLIEAFKYFNFDDEAIIVKLTGRYCFTSRDFLDTVEKNPQMDAFICYHAEFPIPRVRILTGCFALRGKLFKQFLANLDFVKMEKEMVDIEIELGNFIRKLSETHDNILIMNKLGLSAHVGGTGYPPAYQQW